MSQPRLTDVARQFANVFAAIFQVYASYAAGASIGAIAQEFRSLILPATYAFAIWGPIFILCGFYALYQALPDQRENPVLRAIGWWTAGGCLANGLWTYAYANRLFVLAQLIIFAGLLLAGGAYLRYAREMPAASTGRTDDWLLGPALGLLSGWLTAANVAGMAGTLIAEGFAATGQPAEIGGAALLLLGSAVAIVAILASKRGPSAAWVSYGAAVLWALAAIVVEQRLASVLTSLTAAACAVFVLIALVGPWGAPRRPLDQPSAV
jgi:hypothetical protein